MAPASEQFILGLLAAIAMLMVTYRLRHRISIGEDFALARRRLPAWATALSQAINSLPLWLMIAIALYAYNVGLGALWMALACILGQVLNWWVIAPRIRDFTAAPGTYALSQLLTNSGERLQSFTLRSALLIVLLTLGLATITLLQWAAQEWIAAVGGSYNVAVIFLGSLLLLVVAFGGLWSASYIDAAQAVVIALLFIVVAGSSVWEVGGSQALWSGLRARDHLLVTWFSGYSGVLAMAFFVGVTFVAFCSSAQPQVFSRYLACKDEQAFKKARLLALGWTFYALLGALLIGWSARVLLDTPVSNQTAVQSFLATLFNAPVSLFITTLLLIALSAASLSPWLGIATHFATDLRAPHPADATGAGPGLSLSACRWGLFVSAILLTVGAIYVPATNSMDRLWFCWQSLGAAFGPLLFVRLSGKKVRSGSSLGAIWSGFILSGLFHLMPNTPGDLLERSLPFVAAMGIALSGGERRRNPGRADRGDKTVHDHLPI